MSLIRASSPHTHSALSTARMMQLVLLATLPGLAAALWFFGWGVLINIVLATTTAVACEALVMTLRKRPVLFYLRDYSAVVTAVLLALALPPLAPWWIPVVGTVFAIVIAKHLYGGLGFNPFNPAMVGYVVLLISCPVEMTRWPAPLPLYSQGETFPDLLASWQIVLGFAPTVLDGITAATPLEVLKHNTGLLVDQLYVDEAIFSTGRLAGAGWEFINLGFLVGGFFLLSRRVFTWHAPVAMLVTLALMALIFYDGGSSSSHGSPLFHLFSGATMLGAFFIVTDPVTSAVSVRGRLVYGALIGLLIFVIRSWGSYPDAVAFAVLLGNFAAPFIDYFTQPRTYGHHRARRALGSSKE